MQKIVDLSGQTFGQITVIDFSKVKNRISYWNCFCSCNPNKIIELDWHRIRDRKFPNCGCSNTSWKRNNKYDISGEFGIGYIEDIKFYFDLDDYDKLKNTSWHVGTKGYLSGKINNKSIRMHRFIMNFPEGMCVDHINGNIYDNRKNNLRIVTNQENTMNKINKIKNTSSQYFGVSKTPYGKWAACIKFNQKTINLGTFDIEEDAALAYNKKAEELGFLTRNKISERTYEE
jgi:hypothetical protein